MKNILDQQEDETREQWKARTFGFRYNNPKIAKSNGMRTEWDIFVEDVAPDQFDKLDLHVLDEVSHNDMFNKWLETKHCIEGFENWKQDQQDENYERNFGDEK